MNNQTFNEINWWHT